jgi:6-phospho-3-hexuloisomerase
MLSERSKLQGSTLKLLKKTTAEILTSASRALQKVNPTQIDELVDLLLDTKKNNRQVLIIGAGRSGLVGRAFAMRLMHLNFDVHVIGETTTPAVDEEDILFAISGSGSTSIIITACKIAKKVGAKITALTSQRSSPLGRYCDHMVVIRGRTKDTGQRDYFSRQILGVHEPLAPLGTIFETAVSVFLDGLIAELMSRLGKTEDEMRKRHATIE